MCPDLTCNHGVLTSSQGTENLLLLRTGYLTNTDYTLYRSSMGVPENALDEVVGESEIVKPAPAQSAIDTWFRQQSTAAMALSQQINVRSS